jgi:hypothetical protein
MNSPGKAAVFLLPELKVYRVHRALGHSPDAAGWDAQVDAWERALTAMPEAIPIVREAYRLELARLRRLEDKLQSHLGFMAPIVPIATAVIAGLYSVGRERCFWWMVVDLVLAALLIVHLVAGFFLARQGLAPVTLYLAERTTLEEAVESANSVEARMAGTELVAMQYNEKVGVRLNNAIAGVSAALGWLVALLAGAAVVLVLQLW